MKPKYSKKACPNATFSTTGIIWPHVRSYPGCRCGKPAINRRSCGTAQKNNKKETLSEIKFSKSYFMKILLHLEYL
jgi:hypothetical protein